MRAHVYLILRAATSAVVVGLARLDLDGVRRLLRTDDLPDRILDFAILRRIYKSQLTARP